MARELKIFNPEKTVKHGTGTVSADSTSEQFMKVTGDDTFAPQTSSSGAVAGVLYKDRTSGEMCTIAKGGELGFTAIAGSPAVGDEIEVGSDGFPTKKVSGTARGLIISGDATNGWTVAMYE